MRLFWIVLIYFLSVSSVSAQIIFDGGLKAGATTSQVGGDGLAGFDKFGLSGGGFVKMSFNEQWALQMDILFVQKGSRQIPDNEKGIVEYALKFNYIEVPVTVQYDIKDFSIGAGAYASALVTAKEVRDGAEADVLQLYEKQDIGILIDGTYHVSESFFINGRFTQSVLPIRPAPASTRPFYDRGQFNSVIQLMLGFSF